MLWHIQIYGQLKPKLKRELDKIGMTYYQIEWEPDMKSRGFKENTAYLVRPDGYIAWSSEKQDYKSLRKFLVKWFKV